MANVVKSNIANEILLLPIRAITLYDTVDSLTIFQLEEESSYTITPILRNNDEGMPIKIAEKLVGTFYVPFNKWEDFWIGKLEGMKNKAIQLIIALGRMEKWPYFDDNTINETLKTMPINSSSSAYGGYIQTDFNAYVTSEWESIAFRPRMIIRVTAIMRSIYNNLHLKDESAITSYNYTLKRTVY